MGVLGAAVPLSLRYGAPSIATLQWSSGVITVVAGLAIGLIKLNYHPYKHVVFLLSARPMRYGLDIIGIGRGTSVAGDETLY